MTSNPYADGQTAAIPGVPHRWTALTVALTAIGFIVFWPLGLAMIAYVVWGERILAWTRGQDGGGFQKARKAAEEFGRTVRGEFGAKGFAGKGFGPKGFGGGFAGCQGRTGNAAFDAWRDAELERLDAERRKIDETTAAFESHLKAERGAHDESRAREEFDRFMAGRGHGG